MKIYGAYGLPDCFQSEMKKVIYLIQMESMKFLSFLQYLSFWGLHLFFNHFKCFIEINTPNPYKVQSGGPAS